MLHGVVYFVGHLLTSLGCYLEVLHASASRAIAQTITETSMCHVERSIRRDCSEACVRGGGDTSCVLLLKRSLASATVPIDFVLWPT